MLGGKEEYQAQPEVPFLLRKKDEKIEELSILLQKAKKALGEQAKASNVLKKAYEKMGRENIRLLQEVAALQKINTELVAFLTSAGLLPRFPGERTKYNG